MKRILTTLAMTVVLLSMMALPALAQSELDQSQTTINSDAVMDVPFVKQTFTAQKTGTLDAVAIYAGCCHAFDFLSVRTPNPLYVEIGGTRISVERWSSDPAPLPYGPREWLNVPLDPAPFVVAGRQYELQLSTDVVNDGNYLFGVATSDVYPAGEFYYADCCFPQGPSQWFPKSDFELAFQTYVTPDATAPSVDAVGPNNGDRGVSRSTDVTARFSEEMDPATLTASTIRLFKVNPDGTTTRITNVQVKPSADGMSATLDPYGGSSTKLSAKTRYKAVVTTGAKDLAGNALDQNASASGNQQMIWYFNTGTGS